MPKTQRWFWPTLGVVFCLGGLGTMIGSAAAPTGTRPRRGPSTKSEEGLRPDERKTRRLVVKLRAPLADELLGPSRASALPTSSAAAGPRAGGFLDRHAVRSFRPLFPARAEARERAGRSDRDLAQATRDRFPRRAARAPRPFAPPDLSRTYVVEVAQAGAALAADPDVEWVEEERTMAVHLVPNDPFYSSSGTWGQTYADLWGLHRISAGDAWDSVPECGVAVECGAVAVIDTGVDYDHADLAANVWRNSGEIPDNGIDDDANGYVDDARNTVILVMGLYVTNVAVQAGVAKEQGEAMAQRILAVAVACAIVGGFVWGRIVDHIGPKKTLDRVLYIWMGVLVMAAAFGPLGLPLPLFYLIACGAGVAMGGINASDRVYMLRLAPPERIGEFYGLYGMVGRFSAITGPLLWGLIVGTLFAGRPEVGQPVGILLMTVMVIVGWWILRPVSDRPATSA